jgi:hypothetical protein
MRREKQVGLGPVETYPNFQFFKSRVVLYQ